MARGSRVVFQFYPECPEQVEMITSSAIKCGFTGGLLVDYPNSTKAKKYVQALHEHGTHIPPRHNTRTYFPTDITW